MSNPPSGSFTLIVPVHNRTDGLRRALASVALQDVLPQEIIIVDDGSTPPLDLAGLPQPPAAWRLLRHGSNRGAAAARNTGMAASRTAWVTLLDSDDLMLPGTLGARWGFAEQGQRGGDPPLTIYGCAWQEVTPGGTLLRTRQPRPSACAEDFAAGCWFSPGSCIFINAAAARDAAGGQDESLGRLEDLDWFLRLARAGAALKVQPLVGLALERRRQLDVELVSRAADAVMAKWADAAVPAGLRSRLGAYLALEKAAARYYAGDYAGATIWMARSFMRQPRLRLSPSPGFVQ